MGILCEKTNYEKLGKKQREIYNFQMVSAVFAKYGYSVTSLRDDAEFADFVAVPFIRNETTKPFWIQLKGGLTFRDTYKGKDLYICFPDWENNAWYLYPHDQLYNELKSELQKRVEDWDKKHKYETAPSFPAWAGEQMKKYKIDQ